MCFVPDVHHRLWVEEEPYMEFYGMHFTEQNGFAVPDLPRHFSLPNPQNMQTLFRQLIEDSRHPPYMSEWKQDILIQQILHEAAVQAQQVQYPTEMLRIQKILALMQQEPCRSFTISELCDIIREDCAGSAFYVWLFADYSITTYILLSPMFISNLLLHLGQNSGKLRQYRIILSTDTASEVRQPPKRCLSRKAGIVRCCLKQNRIFSYLDAGSATAYRTEEPFAFIGAKHPLLRSFPYPPAGSAREHGATN